MTKLRIAIVMLLAIAAALLIRRALSPAPVSRVVIAPQRAAGVTASVVRRSQTYTLADGATAYFVTPTYTTTIGDLDFVAWIDDRPFDEYGRELPLHFGWHYVHVAPTTEISPTGRWDVALVSTVTETVEWQNTITQTGEMTLTIGDGLVISRPVFAPGALVSMVITHDEVSPLVAGWVSTTRFISEGGTIVPGTISATLDMIFEVHNSTQGLTLDYLGETGALTITTEQAWQHYSNAAYVGDYGLVKFQVQAQTPATDTLIFWWPQFAPAMAGSCAGDLAWADGAQDQWPHPDPSTGDQTYHPLYLWVMTIGADPLGFEIETGGECARVAFESEAAGVTITPTIYVQAVNP